MRLGSQNLYNRTLNAGTAHTSTGTSRFIFQAFQEYILFLRRRLPVAGCCRCRLRVAGCQLPVAGWVAGAGGRWPSLDACMPVRLYVYMPIRIRLKESQAYHKVKLNTEPK